MDEKELEALYKTISNIFDVGNYDTFKSKMQTPDDRKRFYNAVGEKGFDLGDYNEYEKRLGGVKKKVGSIDFEKSSSQSGNTASSPSPLPSSEEGSIDPILGEVTQIKDLESKTKDIPMPSSGKGGNIVVKAPDDASIGEAKKRKENFKNIYGIDFDEFSGEIKDLPDYVYKNEGFKPDELISIKKYNPQNYQRRIATARVQSGIRDMINKQFQDGNIDEDTRKNLLSTEKINTNNYNVGDYQQQRNLVKSQAALIDEIGGENTDKLKSQLAIERAKIYGDSYKNGFDNVAKDATESKYLDKNALLGYQYIKDLSPEKAKQYERLFIDPKTLKNKPFAQSGYNHLMRTVKETGINLQLNAIDEDINNLMKISKDNGGYLTPDQFEQLDKLAKKQDELYKQNDELDNEYPEKLFDKISDATQEILGQKMSWLDYAKGKTDLAFKHTLEGAWEMVSSPFMSDESNNMRELGIMGENIAENYIYHKTDKNKGLTTDTLVIKPELQSQIDAIVNDKSLDASQKEAKLYPLLRDNKDKFGRVPLKNSKLNVSPSSILYGVTDIGTTLLPFVALETITGGGASAGIARKFLSTFTAAATTGFHDTYSEALMEGKSQSEAYKYAMGVTAINSFAMAGAGTPQAIREMAGLKTSAGKIIHKMTDAEIESALKNTPKAIKIFGKNIQPLLEGAANRIKTTPKMLKEGVESGVKFEAAMTGANELKHQIYNTPLDREENFKQSVLGIINFGILGAGLGHIGYKPPTELQKNSFLETGKNPTEYIDKAKLMLKDGHLSQAEFEQVKNNIESSATAYKNLPTLNSKGVELSEKEKGDYLYNEAVKNEALKRQLPPKQKEKAEHTALVADFKNDYILEPKTDKQLESRKNQLEKSLEPKKDAEGKTIEPNEKEVKEAKAELEAINDIIENKPKEQEVDTKLSEPIEGLDEQGVPIGDNVPLPEGEDNPAPFLKEGEGRIPVTLSGSTEFERQQAIESRKKETKQTPMIIERDKILERVAKYNKLNKIEKRKLFEEVSRIKLSIDNFNKNHGQKHSIETQRNGDLLIRNNPKEGRSIGKPIRYILSGNERAINENAKTLNERDNSVKEKFITLLENDVLPIGRRVNGEKMSDIEFEQVIQDIKEGIPSNAAENYLNALEKQIKEDNFDYGNPDKNAMPVSFDDVINISKEVFGKEMTEKELEEWLIKESERTPENAEIYDNIDNLITFYESENNSSREVQQFNTTTKKGVVTEIKPTTEKEGIAESLNKEEIKNEVKEKNPENTIQAESEGAVSSETPKVKQATEAGGQKPPIEPPKNTDAVLSGEGGSGDKKGLDKLAANIPNNNVVREYMSKDTIEKYTGETPQNNQEIIKQELLPALLHGEKVIEKSKEVFGNDYVEKLLDYVEKETLPIQNKALLYISLENALAKEKLENPASVERINKLQKLVYSKSQAFSRENALALNMARLRKIAEVGYDISKITDSFFSTKELQSKSDIENALESDADTINKEAEIKESDNAQAIADENLRIEKLVEEGVAKEVDKIYKSLPTSRRQKADKAIAALESIQKKLRGKAYDAGLGVPVAIIDAGITTIKSAIKAGVKVADAIELGIKKIKAKYGEKWEKEEEFRKDMLEGFIDGKIDVNDSGQSNASRLKEILIEAGFSRNATIKGEKRKILDWKKLAGEEGSIDKMKESVEKVLADRGMSKEEVKEMQNSLVDEYNDLRASIVEKSMNELARRNKETVTPEQKGAAKKLAELYNYGLFDKDTAEYDKLINTAIGSSVSPEGFAQAKKIAEAMQTLYSTTFKGKKLNDISSKAAIQQLENNLRQLLAKEAKMQGNNNYRIANIVRNYMDISQTMVLNNLKQAVENPFSGAVQNAFEKISGELSKEGIGTKEMAKQRNVMMKTIYKDMLVNGGIGYGDVNHQFANRAKLDDYVNKLSDNQLYHGITSVLTGKATLDAMDAMFKQSITEKKFAANLIKILTHETNKNRMPKEEAVKFVSEKLTGQTFKDAQITAKEVIDKINKDAGEELVSTSQTSIDRLANDIVKSALEMGEKLTTEQINAAYKAAYKAAGEGLGHEANNPLSAMVTGYTGKIEKEIQNAVKEKDWNKAAYLTYESTIWRNMINPFVGGGTNWLILKLEKTGLGLFTGLYYRKKYLKDGRIDLSSEQGVKNLDKALYNQALYKDKFIRGAIGGGASILTYLAFMGVASTDGYREWRNKNKWAKRYLDTFTPEFLLAQMSVENKELARYFEGVLNKNDSFDATTKLIKGIWDAEKGDKERMWGALGEVMGSKFNFPLPWRLVKDGQVLYQGVTGKDPYNGDYSPSVGGWNGLFKGGLIEYLGYRPEKSK